MHINRTPFRLSPLLHPPCFTSHRPLCVLQGMATEKAKLAFVKQYYEFLPKALYNDTRGK